MKRKIAKLYKDGTPAKFRLRCGNTLTIKTISSGLGFKGYEIVCEDDLLFAATRRRGGNLDTDEDWGLLQNTLNLIVGRKALPTLIKLAQALLELPHPKDDSEDFGFERERF